MTETDLSYRIARPDDAPAIVRLVNAAYRGASGWTREAHLLSGARTDEADVLGLIGAPDSLVLLCLRGDTLIGCAHLANEGAGEGYLGMLAVDPGAQEGGLGKVLMARAETFARERWGVGAISISVINRRDELIAYYVRRGYVPTGETRPFPFADGLSAALVDGIALTILRKELPRT